MKRTAANATIDVALTTVCAATAAAVNGDELVKQAQFTLPK